MHGEPAPLSPHLQAELGGGRRPGAERYPGERVNELRRPGAYARMPEGFDIMLGNGSMS